MTTDLLVSVEVGASAAGTESDGAVVASAGERSGSRRTREERKRKEAFIFGKQQVLVLLLGMCYLKSAEPW